MIDLVVIASFWGYQIGDRITDDHKIATVLHSHPTRVVRVARPAKPVEPAKPATESKKVPPKGAV